MPSYLYHRYPNKTVFILKQAHVSHESQYHNITWTLINSLPPVRYCCNLKFIIFKLISTIEHFLWNCLQVNATEPRWGLVQVMGWCRQTTSHYLRQCWSSSLPPLGHNQLFKETIKVMRSVEAGDRPQTTALCLFSLRNPYQNIHLLYAP